jgi:hypothetical protein
MESLTCELNGIKYLLVQEIITDANKESKDEKFEKFECIFQGVYKIEKGGFFSDSYALVKILVPEKNVIAYNAENFEP